MKKIAIVIRALPFNTIRNSEALRCAVGLTIEEENQIQVFFIDDGVWTASSLDCNAAKNNDLDKHVETLEMLGVELIVEQEALIKRDIKVYREGIIAMQREAINQTIKEADVVIAF